MSSAARQHGGADALGAPLYDFSTNSNACGPCPAVRQAVAEADASRYPDPHYAAVRQQLAEFHQVAVSRVLLAASASEFIFRITSWVAQQGARAVSTPQYAYGDYAHAAVAHGLAAVVSGECAALHWACEPASPLGTSPSLSRWLAAAGLRVLDCAYAPLRLSGQSALSAAQHDAVWRLYTPNKALGLTGVRAAYAVAPRSDAGQHEALALNALCPSWPVGAHGVALLLGWTLPATQAWLAGSLHTLRAWKTQQTSLCEALGWQTLPSEANFFCARPAPLPASAWPSALDALRLAGIKLRDARSFGLPEHVRLGVLAPCAQQALKTAWHHLMSKLP